MSDPIVNIVRREIEEARNRKGMKAGLPTVTIDASHAERLCNIADLVTSHGYVLANLSGLENKDVRIENTEYNRGRRDGWNECVSSIEIIEF